MYEVTAMETVNREIVERSLVSTGNNHRMKMAAKRASNGEAITIAYLGGSITEGFNAGGLQNYVKLSYEFFVNTYGVEVDKAKYINAGMAGTPSTLGLIRARRDVLQHEPDIVFVEFAVNDSNDGRSMTGFEGLVRQLLSDEKKPAVLLLFTLNEQGYSAQHQMEMIGSHYSLPMISVKDAIGPSLSAGQMTWSDYSDDSVHPHVQGHVLIAEFIQHYYELLEGQELDVEMDIPEGAVYGRDFERMVMWDAENTTASSYGGFISERTTQQFPNGWIHRTDAGNEPFVLDLTASSLFIVTKESQDTSTGEIDIYVDGELTLTVNGYSSTGWNNPVTKLVFRDERSGDHRIEIRMADGSEAKVFSILAFGVVQ